MQPNPTASAPPDNWRSRCNIARSLLNQREPSERLIELVHAALDGATVQDLFDMERLNVGFGDL